MYITVLHRGRQIYPRQDIGLSGEMIAETMHSVAQTQGATVTVPH